MTNFSSCPFCGGKSADYKERHYYLTIGICVECPICGVSTKTFMVNQPRMTADGVDESTRYTLVQAKRLAFDAWERRSK